ncbi:hypothetical protein BZ17_2624 [Yersinia pseudotuberculosis IP 32953]|uniref:Uncharacterized protein n=7 Tax=Yersinia pseudotuberculosis complex TaxID=1649845 RepID=Q663S3_YERPS|nr:hypothetical protein [Yersinia pseudotuberculosis]CQD57476.1 membrane protein [Yersinia intermedia]AJJ03373.1 hypothetical protein BZ21_3314 [Yersinia pseudotuberculosis]AJJ55736.1 hypothetical protein BZ17_2624 [Yersinia pseudotuberculosis IP 32953]AJJ61001.1 hypothetical protein BZ22_582 [Yersinia pseudotuberculosis YPIII]AJJ65573.1 hypothetical protein BZ16_3446 [Yersinia pseudotuberculosis PB1/+]
MAREIYDPSWTGAMGDFLNGNTKINQLKPQHEFFDSIGLEKILRNEKQYHVVLTTAEANDIIDDITNRTQKKMGVSTPESFARGVGEQITSMEAFSRGIDINDPFAPIFKVTDPTSTYAGNIHDVRGLYNVIMEFKKIGIKATIFIGDNGTKFVKISGYAGLRKIITGTRYLTTNPQILEMGIGLRGIASGIIRGAKFCIIFFYRI